MFSGEPAKQVDEFKFLGSLTSTSTVIQEVVGLKQLSPAYDGASGRRKSLA